MKTIREQKEALDELNNLISNMEVEIELLRAIVYRYYLMHGGQILDGNVKIKDNISFNIVSSSSSDARCISYDSDKIGVKSNYQEIKRLLNKHK
jgi:hypothetical protein